MGKQRKGWGYFGFGYDASDQSLNFGHSSFVWILMMMVWILVKVWILIDFFPFFGKLIMFIFFFYVRFVAAFICWCAANTMIVFGVASPLFGIILACYSYSLPNLDR
jgi:hypothetical protein